MLSRFVKEVSPGMSEILGDHTGYYWTLWQSEMARDYIFNDPQSLSPLLDGILRHAIITGTYGNVLKYMGRPVRKDGQPHRSANPELLTKVNTWHDGMKVRHYVDNNNVKIYNQQSVLRIEMTMNNPNKYLIHRF